MSASLVVCRIPEDLKERLKRFRFTHSSATNALILKIDKDLMELCVEGFLEDCSVDEIRDELPAQYPRFVVISYELRHPSDGKRVSYPLCLLFYSPVGCSPEQKMLYAGSRNNLVQECQLNKSAEIRDLDEITSEFLNERFS